MRCFGVSILVWKEQLCNITLVLSYLIILSSSFLFQAEDGIRDAQESRGLGDVYKRQAQCGGRRT